MPVVVIVKVSRTPWGKVTLVGLVKLGALSAKSAGTAVKVGKVTTAARTNRRTTRSKDSMRKLLGEWVGMVNELPIQPDSCQGGEDCEMRDKYKYLYHS